MALSLPSPTREIDIDFLVFVERYATDLLKWDLLTFFAHHPDYRAPAPEIAAHLNRPLHLVRPELGELVLAGILTQTQPADGPLLYQLTTDSHLRQMTLKFTTLCPQPTPTETPNS